MIPAIDGATIAPPGHVVPFSYLVHQSGATAMLDLGCGSGFFGMLFRIHNVGGCQHSWLGGIDLHPEKCTFKEWYDWVLPGDVTDGNDMALLVRRVPVGMHAIVMLAEVLEHLAPEKGMELLHVMKAAKVPAIISSPSEAFDLHRPGEAGLEHVSSWTVDDVKRAGFNVVAKFDIHDMIYDTKHWMVLAL